MSVVRRDRETGFGHNQPLANGRFCAFYYQQKALRIEFSAERGGIMSSEREGAGGEGLWQKLRRADSHAAQAFQLRSGEWTGMGFGLTLRTATCYVRRSMVLA